MTSVTLQIHSIKFQALEEQQLRCSMDVLVAFGGHNYIVLQLLFPLI